MRIKLKSLTGNENNKIDTGNVDLNLENHSKKSKRINANITN